VIKILEAQVGQFLLGCKCPVSRDIVVQEQDSLGDLSAAFFLQNVLQLHQQRWVILRVDSLALYPKSGGLPRLARGFDQSGVVTVLGRPGRGASQVERSPRLNWATQRSTVA